MGNCNEFLSRDWDVDIERVFSPVESFEDTRDLSVFNLPANSFHRLIVDGMMVESEETDRLLLSKNGSNERSYQPHPYLWMGTMDEYIEYYWRLAERHEPLQDSDKWHVFVFPSSLEAKYVNQFKERIRARKNLNINKIKEHLLFIGGNAENRFKTEKLGAGAFLNYIFRELSTKGNATNIHCSLDYDGLKFRLEEYDSNTGLSAEQIRRIIPDFTIIDYYAHELLTGISLSIEITAILLELNEKLPDQKLWDEAFSVFCEEALPRIVQSRSIFTRISVARLFFLQVFWDEMVRMYRWHGHSFLESDFYKILSFRKALSHCDVLNNLPFIPDCPDDEIKLSMDHIQGLLYEMKEPINLSQCISTPTRRIAIFCNPQHRHVSRFINELEYLSSGIGISELNTKDKKLFKRVHAQMRIALKRDKAKQKKN